MVTILIMSAKSATLGFHKMKALQIKGYDVIISVHEVTNKILSQHLFEKSYNNLNFIRILPKGQSWFGFNNLGLALGMVLEFYTRVAKRVKTKSQKNLVANSYVCRSYRKILGGGGPNSYTFCISQLQSQHNKIKTTLHKAQF